MSQYEYAAKALQTYTENRAEAQKTINDLVFDIIHNDTITSRTEAESAFDFVLVRLIENFPEHGYKDWQRAIPGVSRIGLKRQIVFQAFRDHFLSDYQEQE